MKKLLQKLLSLKDAKVSDKTGNSTMGAVCEPGGNCNHEDCDCNHEHKEHKHKHEHGNSVCACGGNCGCH